MNSLKTVAYFSNAAEAGMVQELLENNGIPVSTQGGNFAALEPLRIPGGFSEIRLSVNEADYEQARSLYQAFFTSSDSSADSLIDDSAWLTDEAADEFIDNSNGNNANGK